MFVSRDRGVASAGEVLEDPVTGQRIVFEATAHETGGELLRLRASGEPGGFFAQEHLHPHQSERHEVVSGEVGLAIDGREQVLGPGEEVVVPPGRPHRLISHGPAEIRFEVRPALRSEVLAETLTGLARDGKVSKRGLPNLLQLAVIARDFEEEGYATRPPLAIQRALFGPLATLGRRLGYRARYPEYSGPE
jgi:mannose-6-phosphate isomerase-like protein (cupin superfamily)